MRVQKLRIAARKAGYRLHYSKVGGYSLHGPNNYYGLSLDDAEAIIERKTS